MPSRTRASVNQWDQYLYIVVLQRILGDNLLIHVVRTVESQVYESPMIHNGLAFKFIQPNMLGIWVFCTRIHFWIHYTRTTTETWIQSREPKRKNTLDWKWIAQTMITIEVECCEFIVHLYYTIRIAAPNRLAAAAAAFWDACPRYVKQQ